MRLGWSQPLLPSSPTKPPPDPSGSSLSPRGATHGSPLPYPGLLLPPHALPVPRREPPMGFFGPTPGLLSPTAQTLLLVEPHRFLAPEPMPSMGTLLSRLSLLTPFFHLPLLLLLLSLSPSPFHLLRSTVLQVGICYAIFPGSSLCSAVSWGSQVPGHTLAMPLPYPGALVSPLPRESSHCVCPACSRVHIVLDRCPTCAGKRSG